MTSAGVISGTPTLDGSFGFVVQVLDARRENGQQVLRHVRQPGGSACYHDGSPLPNATVNAPYTQTFTAIGGFPPYTWSLATGSLPSGLSLSSSGVLSGTPTQMGTVTFDVSVGDTDDHVATKTFTVTTAPPGPPSITTATLPGGTVNIAYSQTLAATGGTPPYNWGLSSGTLPPGLTITSGGVIQGTPTTAGNYTFLPAGHGQHGHQRDPAVGDRHQQHRILHYYRIALPDAFLNVPYSQQLAAGGGSGNYGWQLNSELCRRSLAFQRRTDLRNTHPRR